MKKYLLVLLSVACFSTARSQSLPPVHHAPNREFHMKNIVLNFKFDMTTKTLFGKATETIEPLRTRLDSVHLNAVDMKIESVTMAGRPLSYHYNGKILTVIFKEKYGLGSQLTYAIKYSTKPTRGIFFITPDKGYPHRDPEVWSNSEPEDARYWFPCHDYPDDFTSSSVIATVPENWTVISNGVLKSVTTVDGGKEKKFDWVEARPHVVYLISIIAGIFKRFEDHYGKTPIYYYSDPKYGDLITQNFKREPDVLKFYSHITGHPFPWEKLALTTVTNFTWGGEENVSAITLTDRTIHDRFAEPQISSVSLIAHETAHQWFGDLLTTRNWANAWLNEGFATYFEALYREHAYGEKEFEYEMYHNHNQVIAADNVDRRPTVYNRYYDPVDVFGTYIYPRGASMLHMLRFFLGNQLFDKAIRHYVKEFKHRNVDTRDFSNAIREATGYNVNWFFNEWLYKGGHPIFDVSYKYHPGTQKVLMKVSQVQKVDSLTPVYKMPVDIYIATPMENINKRVWVDSLMNTFSFTVPDKPLMVNFDEGHWLLDQVHFRKSEKELAYQMKSDSDVVGRIWAADQLEKHYKNESEALLIAALKTDDFWGVRRKCAQLLGDFVDSGSREALIAATHDADARVEEAAIRSLGNFKGDRDLEGFLSGIFYDQQNYFVRAAAITAMSDIDSAAAFHAIYTALDRDSYGEVIRTAALNGLTKIRPNMAYLIATNYAKYGEPEALRTTGLRVLAKLDMNYQETIARFSKYLSDPYIWARAGAIEGLGRIGKSSVIPLLRERMKVEPDGRLVAMARRAIESIEARDK
ncbi:MAG: M1 family metallopeptidase [Bacteroidetes bacterium]|nr:M1 family metallopeptidase [Bacteroidota bacterium]MCL5034279.1 M1 family metallopeptidase [Bacteroidota bacterium]